MVSGESKRPEAPLRRAATSSRLALPVSAAGLLSGVVLALTVGYGSNLLLEDRLSEAGQHDEEALRILQGARTLAAGPMADLEYAYFAYVSVVEMYGDDAVLWHGIERLAEHALTLDTKAGYQIAKRILFLVHFRTPPIDMVGLELQLEDLIWSWELKKR